MTARPRDFHIYSYETTADALSASTTQASNISYTLWQILAWILKRRKHAFLKMV
jgi:hypothetical protein